MLAKPGITRSPCVVAQLSMPTALTGTDDSLDAFPGGGQGHVGVRMRGAMFAIDRVVAGLDSVRLENSRLQPARLAVDQSEHILDFIVVDRGTGQERARAGDEGVQLVALFFMATLRLRRFSSM